jgi:hypothetical protein
MAALPLPSAWLPSPATSMAAPAAAMPAPEPPPSARKQVQGQGRAGAGAGAGQGQDSGRAGAGQRCQAGGRGPGARPGQGTDTPGSRDRTAPGATLRERQTDGAVPSLCVTGMAFASQWFGLCVTGLPWVPLSLCAPAREAKRWLHRRTDGLHTARPATHSQAAPAPLTGQAASRPPGRTQPTHGPRAIATSPAQQAGHVRPWQRRPHPVTACERRSRSESSCHGLPSRGLPSRGTPPPSHARPASHVYRPPRASTATASRSQRPTRREAATGTQADRTEANRAHGRRTGRIARGQGADRAHADRARTCPFPLGTPSISDDSKMTMRPPRSPVAR